MSGARPSREEVLDAFSVEPRSDRDTLERYLRAYPEHAEDLIDLARELARDPCDDDAPLSSADHERIAAALRRHQSADRSERATNPLFSLSGPELRELARRLDVPRQVIAAFRERRVLLSSVPRRFLADLAAAIGSSIDELLASWAAPAPPATARSYKAETKPDDTGMVSFEQLLIDAVVPEDRRKALIAGER